MSKVELDWLALLAAFCVFVFGVILLISAINTSIEIDILKDCYNNGYYNFDNQKYYIKCEAIKKGILLEEIRE